MDIFYKVFSQVKVNDFCLVHRHRLNSDAIQDKILVKKIRQFCLVNEQNNLPPGYTQEQLAEVLGVDQSLVSRAVSKAAAQLTPLTNKPSKRQKRSDAFEVQHAAVVVVIGEFWVRLYSSCTYQTMVKTKFTSYLHGRGGPPELVPMILFEKMAVSEGGRIHGPRKRSKE
jgi:hypothetical protein